MRRPEPSRGDVWLVDLNPTKGYEQSGVRPGLVISTDVFNHRPAGLVVMLPLPQGTGEFRYTSESTRQKVD